MEISWNAVGIRRSSSATNAFDVDLSTLTMIAVSSVERRNGAMKETVRAQWQDKQKQRVSEAAIESKDPQTLAAAPAWGSVLANARNATMPREPRATAVSNKKSAHGSSPCTPVIGPGIELSYVPRLVALRGQRGAVSSTIATCQRQYVKWGRERGMPFGAWGKD